MKTAERFIIGCGKWGMYIFDTQNKEALTLVQTQNRLNEHLISGLDSEIIYGQFGAYFRVKGINLDLFSVIKILNSLKYDLRINMLEWVLE